MIKRIIKALLRIPIALLCLVIFPLDEELADDLEKWAELGRCQTRRSTEAKDD